jgi:hypothetical protein
MSHADLMNFLPIVFIALGFLIAAPIAVWFAQHTDRQQHA